MQAHSLTFETKLYRSLDEIFDFFSNAENLNTVTPTEVEFSMLTPTPIKMQVGTLINYRIKLMGIPFYWRTHINVWEPPYRFVDEQVKGPYILWHHEHTFEQKDGYVLMTDKLHYLSPGWFLEPLINRFFVTPQIKKIWQYRDQQFKKLFGKKEETFVS
jgi:ligand-binding SRPBCC domain-containing protein